MMIKIYKIHFLDADAIHFINTLLNANEQMKWCSIGVSPYCGKRGARWLAGSQPSTVKPLTFGNG